MIDLNLQMFSDDETGTPDEVYTEPDTNTAEIDSETFAEMYENGADGDDYEEPTEEPDETNETQENQPHEGDHTLENEPDQDFKNERNAFFASQRRQQEEAQRQQRALDELVSEMFDGQVNPFTNQPVKTLADYKAYKQQLQEDQLRQAGISNEQLEQIVNSRPEVQQAQQILEQQRIQAQQESLARGQQQINDEVATIAKLDPSIKTFDDIARSDNFAEINEKVQRGYTLLDAYKIVNMDRIMSNQKKAVKQKTLNQVASKSHMKTTGQNGAGYDISVPPDIMAAYREMMPKATTKEIQAHYKRHMKG